LPNNPLNNLDPQLTYDINDLSSGRLAELAKGAGVRREGATVRPGALSGTFDITQQF
jgi:hypothetical protein